MEDFKRLFPKEVDVTEVLLRESARRESAQKMRYDELAEIVKGIERRFKTSFIGSLSILEKQIGFKWGHGKRWEELNEEERVWRDIWSETRETMLNHSNNQMRMAVNELIRSL